MEKTQREDLIAQSRLDFIEKEKSIKTNIVGNIETTANEQGLTLVTDDEYENSLSRTVAKDAFGNYYDYDSNSQEFVLRTVDRLKDIILNGGDGNFSVTDIMRTIERNIDVAANKLDLTLVTDDEYENSLSRTVAKDAFGNYYDYDSKNQEFVLRTVDRIQDIILNGGKGNFSVTDIMRTVERNIGVAAYKLDLTLVTDDEYENSLNRTVAKDAVGNYYDYDSKNQEFVLRTVDRLQDIILNGGDGNFSVTDIMRTVKRNIDAAANKLDLTLVTDDEYENSHSRTVAKDAVGNYYDYDSKNQEFVLRTVDRIQDIILNGGKGNFSVTDIMRTVERNIDAAANKLDLTLVTDDEYENSHSRTVAKDAVGNYYDYDAKNQEFVLRTVDRIQDLILNGGDGNFTVTDIMRTVERNLQIAEGADNTDSPTKEDITAADDYQRFIDNERNLGNHDNNELNLDILPLDCKYPPPPGTNTPRIVDGLDKDMYKWFIDHEKGLIDGVSVIPSIKMGTTKSDSLKSSEDPTIFQFDIKSGKGSGSDKIYNSNSSDAIVFSVEDELSSEKLENKISTVTKSGNNLVISYNSYKKGKKTITDKLTVVNYFKQSSEDSLKDVAIVDNDGNVIDTLNLQEQTLKFSGKGKISDTVFNDKITGSKKNDTYTFKNGGEDVVTDKNGKDKYNITLNDIDKVTINDKKGKDSLILNDVNKSDVVFGLNISKTEANGEITYTLGKELFVMTENEDNGFVQINNFFKSFTDKDKDGNVDSFKYGSGRIETFKYADGSGFSFNAANINEIKSNVVAWLNDHEGYASTNEVFANGSKEDIQSLIAAYSGNYQA